LLEYGPTYSGAYLLRRGLFLPWELPEVLDGDLVREGWQELQTLLRLEETHGALRNQRLKVTSLEVCWYMRQQLLRDSDWAGMAHSLEIRVPLVDVELWRRVAPLAVSAMPPTKLDLANTPKQKLPVEVLQRPKTGFSIPVRDWLMAQNSGTRALRGLRDWARQVYAHFNGN
jgi:asparagine synthase (glutamine-hydrolysing)